MSDQVASGVTDEMISESSVECDHAAVMPTVTDDELNGLSVDEVRERHPRFMGECPECGMALIAYASFRHYLAGDW